MSPGKTRRRIAAEELAELVAVEAKMKKATAELKAIVLARGSRLMDLLGVGPVVAARILADVGDVARFADRNRFASWTGTAPLDASSGEQNRHRLSRAGNRRMNHMIHIAAISQLRVDSEGRAYYRRKRSEGKKPLEAIRCLKRRISDAIYRQLVADAQASRRNGPGRALRGDSNIQRGRLPPAHRHFGPATSRTRTTDATRTIPDPEDQPPTEPCRRPVDNRREPMWVTWPVGADPAGTEERHADGALLATPQRRPTFLSPAPGTGSDTDACPVRPCGRKDARAHRHIRWAPFGGWLPQ